MTMRTSPASTMAEVRRRSSRRSNEVQTRQRHPMTGTPCEVPVPRKVSFMQTKIVKIWRLRTRAGKILRTDFRIRRKTGYERTERQGGAVHGKRAERRPKKSGQIVSREETRNRQPEKADKSSAGKSRRKLPKRKRKTKEKRAERQTEKRRSIAPNTPRREQAAKAKKAAGCFLRLFSISGQRAERPAISRSARYSRRRPASLAVWWRRPFHGRPPSAARPFRRRRSP